MSGSSLVRFLSRVQPKISNWYFKLPCLLLDIKRGKPCKRKNWMTVAKIVWPDWISYECACGVKLGVIQHYKVVIIPSVTNRQRPDMTWNVLKRKLNPIKKTVSQLDEHWVQVSLKSNQLLSEEYFTPLPRRVFWHLGRVWNTKNGWGKIEWTYIWLSIKSDEIEHNRPRSEDTVTAGLKTTNTSPRQQCPCVVFNFATFDRQSDICSLFAHPFLVFQPRPKCQNTWRDYSPPLNI